MHMPGHKRNPSFHMADPYTFDVTEVKGTDNLHHPEGVIRQEMDRLKEIYGTGETYLSVNGSTCGILASISACCRRGDRILVARNSHRSVYHGIALLELEPVYVYPEIDSDTGISLGVSPEKIRQILAIEPDIACAVITSPTYEGVLSDISSIADILHEKDIPLIVDEAHGAHFAWSDMLPHTAIEEGADLAVESLHKTLPALTQTALLHLCSDRVPRERVERYLDVYETSSPSYVLMGSISQCIGWLLDQGEEAFERYDDMLQDFRKMAREWKHLSLWDIPYKDPGKLVIWTGGSSISGPDLARVLREEYSIEVEMEAADYILAMTTVADTKGSILGLAKALTMIDMTLEDAHVSQDKECIRAVYRMGSGRALESDYEALPLSRCLGRISAEYAMLYPPGSPFLVPGEEVTDSVMRQITSAVDKGLNLQGLADETGKTLRVCRMEES